jgi:hypothetical protein
MSAPGVVLDRPGVTIFDLRELPSEPSDEYLAGSSRKVLVRDHDGDPVIVARFVKSHNPEPSAGWSANYHLAREFHFGLGGGDSMTAEIEPAGMLNWDNGQAILGGLIKYGPGFWLDRGACTLHGKAPGTAFSGGPTKWLYWYTKGNTNPFVGAREAAELTRSVPFGGRPQVANALPPVGEPRTRDPYARRPGDVSRPGIVFLNTYAMEWEPHPELPGAHQKSLSSALEGDPGAEILGLSEGRFPVPKLPYRVSHDYRDILYVIDGSLTVWEYADEGDETGEPVTLKQGYFVDRRPGSIYGFEDADAAPEGCTLLHIRFRKDAEFVKEGEIATVWTRSKQKDGLRPYATEEQRRADIASIYGKEP